MLARGGDGPHAEGRGDVVIVVTGATGHVGAEVVPLLVERDVPVRVVTRRQPVAFPAAVRRGDTVQVPFASTPAVPIDPADIAAVAVAALTTGEHRNVAYKLSDPQVLTPADELRLLGEVLDRPLRLVEPEAATFRSWMLGAGMSEAAVDAIIARSLPRRPTPPRSCPPSRRSPAGLPRPSPAGRRPTPTGSRIPVREKLKLIAVAGLGFGWLRRRGRSGCACGRGSRRPAPPRPRGGRGSGRRSRPARPAIRCWGRRPAGSSG